MMLLVVTLMLVPVAMSWLGDGVSVSADGGASDVLMIRECVGEEEAAGEMGDGEEEVGEEEVGEEEESDDEGDEFERACLLALGESWWHNL